MKGFVLCVAVALGIFVSNFVVAQESQVVEAPPAQTVIDGSVVESIETTVATAAQCCCKPTLVGMSQHAVRQAVCRGRQTVRTLWSKRPQLLRRCRCC